MYRFETRDVHCGFIPLIFLILFKLLSKSYKNSKSIMAKLMP